MKGDNDYGKAGGYKTVVMRQSVEFLLQPLAAAYPGRVSRCRDLLSWCDVQA